MPQLIFEGFIVANLTKLIGEKGKTLLDAMNVDGDIIAKKLKPDYEFTVERDEDWTEEEIELIKKGIEDQARSTLSGSADFYVRKKCDIA